MTRPNVDPLRVERYAERYFQRSGCMEFPTVRQVARALRLRQQEIEQAVEDHPDSNLQLTAWNMEGGVSLGEHFVETFGPPAEISR